MWGQVLTSKYGGWHGLMGNSALSWKSLWWKDLKKLCGSEVDNPWFDENILWKIGRGDKCRFWKDVWVMVRWYIMCKVNYICCYYCND